MLNHLRAKHPEVLPEHVGAGRSSEASTKRDALDSKLVSNWVCLGSLKPIAMIDDPHIRAVFEGRLQLCHEDRLAREVEAVIGEIKEQVKSEVQAARDSGCRFCLSGDSWRPKMRVRKCFLAVYLHWVYPSLGKCARCAFRFAKRRRPEMASATGMPSMPFWPKLACKGAM